jgi:hypothetical protein
MTDYYKIGYLSPRNVVNKPPTPLCYQNLTCVSKNFSMCRFPNKFPTEHEPKKQEHCNDKCRKYLSIV